MTDCSSDESCESAKRRNWMKGFSFFKCEVSEGGVVVDVVAVGVPLEVFISE